MPSITPASMMSPSDLTKVKEKMLLYVPPLRAAVDALAVGTPEEYHEADSLLTQIRLRRSLWLDGPEDDTNPKRWKGINAIIKPFYEGLQGLYELRNTGVKPFDEMEARVKKEMKTFKIREAEQLAAELKARELEQQRLQKEIEKKAKQEEAARTEQMREKIIAQRVQLEQSVQEMKKEKPPLVKGAGSSARTVKRWVISDLAAFVAGTQDGSVPLSYVQPNKVAIEELWKSHPDVLAGLPGVTIEQDILIAGR